MSAFTFGSGCARVERVTMIANDHTQQAIAIRVLELDHAARILVIAIFYDIGADLLNHQAQHVAVLERELLVLLDLVGAGNHAQHASVAGGDFNRLIHCAPLRPSQAVR
jgi:hypothetical protein